MRKAQNLDDILEGYPIKEGKTLYARVTCPCCGKIWFANAAEDAMNVHFEQAYKYGGPGYYACTVICENCNYHVEDCEFVSEEELRESYKNFGKEKED